MSLNLNIEFHFVSNINVIMALCLFQETQDPSAVLWLDEIQDAILRANQDTQEALLCKHPHTGGWSTSENDWIQLLPV